MVKLIQSHNTDSYSQHRRPCLSSLLLFDNRCHRFQGRGVSIPFGFSCGVARGHCNVRGQRQQTPHSIPEHRTSGFRGQLVSSSASSSALVSTVAYSFLIKLIDTYYNFPGSATLQTTRTYNLGLKGLIPHFTGRTFSSQSPPQHTCNG